jgi:hypothetical protein
MSVKKLLIVLKELDKMIIIFVFEGKKPSIAPKRSRFEHMFI